MEKNYRGFQVSAPSQLTNGNYRVYVTRSNGSIVVTGDGKTPDKATNDAIANIDYYLDKA